MLLAALGDPEGAEAAFRRAREAADRLGAPLFELVAHTG
jgi:hypothetical protein